MQATIKTAYIAGTYNTNHPFTLELFGLGLIFVVVICIIIWYLTKQK